MLIFSLAAVGLLNYSNCVICHLIKVETHPRRILPPDGRNGQLIYPKAE
jgi:hypothetical protein